MKFNLVHLFVLVSVANFMNAQDMESVLEVGRENQKLSAVSQVNIDATERKADKIVNEWKAVAKQVEGLILYNKQKRIQIQALRKYFVSLDCMNARDANGSSCSPGFLSPVALSFLSDDLPFD